MYKRTVLLLLIILLITACAKNSTEVMDSPLIGNWNLTSMNAGGTAVNKNLYTGVPVKFLFSYNGSGTVWKEDYGKAAGSSDFTWNTSGTTLTIQPAGGAQATYTYSITGSQLTITAATGEQYFFVKQS